MAERSPQVIPLRLLHPEEMFVLGQTDLFSEHRNFLTGVERAISTLRGHRSGRPVRLEVTLPVSRVDDGTADRIRRTLGRYCDDRIDYNRAGAAGHALRRAAPTCGWGCRSWSSGSSS